MADIDTGNGGIIVGVEPSAFSQQQQEQVVATNTSNTLQYQQSPSTPPQKFYTDEDLARVREQEKAKLYPQIESLKEKLDRLEEERNERLRLEEELKKREEDDRLRKEKEDLTLKQRLERAEFEFEEKLLAERRAREEALALVEKEREFAEFSQWRALRVAEESENIMPELRDLISGNSRDEVEQSIAVLKERTNRIIDSVQAQQQQARRETAGTRVTAPATGPTDINMGDRTLSAEDIKSMSMADYMKHRDKLLGGGARGRSGGLFG